jgi:hypothetical protein
MRFSSAVVLLTASAILFCHAGTGAATITFSDQTISAGLAFTPGAPIDMSNREMYAGGSVGDFNRDGWPDLFLLGGGLVADALFINNGDGTFTDRAFEWGVDVIHRGRGTTVGDYDADGWPDIYVTSGGDMTGADRFGQHRLYRNNGNDTFTDVGVAAGVHNSSALNLEATGAAFGDIDLDGDLDLFVCGWETTGCALFPCDQNRLFRNDGDGTFTDITAVAGIVNSFVGFSPRFLDMNGDHYPELLIAADYGTSRYYVNDGDGTFTDRTLASGTGLDDDGMGSAIADFNGDGLPDWYVTSIFSDSGRELGNYLYLNQGNDIFSALPEQAGASDGGWGWGVEAVDLNHDGLVDIIETNGWVVPEWMGETSYLFQNQGGSAYAEVQFGSGFIHYGQGRTMLKLDYDRDGDMDIVVTSYAEPVKLFRNDLIGSDTNWIEVVLDSSAAPWLAPDGYGAKVMVTAGGVPQTAWADGGATYLGRSQHIVHFGLSTESQVDVLVEWPDGSTTSMPGLSTNQIVTAAPVVFGSAPGEASGDPAGLLLVDYDASTEEVLIDYTPACDASNHTIYYGKMYNLSSHIYTGAVCWLGSSGSMKFEPGRDDTFFLVVGHNGVVEGSYGLFGPGSERPEATALAGCDLPQDLTGTCDVP